MNFRNPLIIAACFSVLLSWSPVTSNAQTLDFSIDGGNSFGNSFDVATGSTTNVEVYLSDVAPGTVLSSEGLFGFGLRGDLDSTAAGSVASASINPTFDFVTTDDFNAIAIEWEAAVLANSIPTASSVLLGSFQFNSTGSGVSALTFGDIDPGSTSLEANWLSGFGTELDESIFGSGSANTFVLSLNSNAVPEPGTASLFVFGSMVLSAFRRRRQ